MRRGGRRGYGTPSRDRYSTCRGVMRIKVPLTPVGPMGRVALYPNAPAPPPPQASKPVTHQLSIAAEKQVGSSVCVCECVHVLVCFEQSIFQHCSWAASGCCHNKNEEILPLFLPLFPLREKFTSSPFNPSLTYTHTHIQTQAHTHIH